MDPEQVILMFRDGNLDIDCRELYEEQDIEAVVNFLVLVGLDTWCDMPIDEYVRAKVCCRGRGKRQFRFLKCRLNADANPVITSGYESNNATFSALHLSETVQDYFVNPVPQDDFLSLIA